MTDAAFDRRKLMAEIEADVRERRAAGDFPPGFETELDALFERFAPPAAVESFDAALDQAESRAFIDGGPPLESRRRVVHLAKRVLAKLSYWYVRAVAFRVTEFNASVSRAVRLLGRRVDRIERALPAIDPRVQREIGALTTSPDVSGWIARVAELLAGVPGRVLVAESGDSKLLQALLHQGLDAYGTEPRRALVDDAVLAGIEVRHEDAVAHLHSLAPDVLDAVVLVGCPEQLAVGSLLELVDSAATRVRVGGRVIVLSADPRSWSRDRSPVAADLSPGRPLHHATWGQLMASRGLVSITVDEADDTPTLDPLPGDDAAAAAVNRNLARLAEQVFGPSSYLVTGVREH